MVTDAQILRLIARVNALVDERNAATRQLDLLVVGTESALARSEPPAPSGETPRRRSSDRASDVLERAAEDQRNKERSP